MYIRPGTRLTTNTLHNLIRAIQHHPLPLPIPRPLDRPIPHRQHRLPIVILQIQIEALADLVTHPDYVPGLVVDGGGGGGDGGAAGAGEEVGFIGGRGGGGRGVGDLDGERDGGD